MAKEICISSTPHETRLAILEDDQLAEIYYERENEYTLAGSIYNGRVTRVLPGMQSAFVDLGLERDAFLYVTDFLELEDQEETDELEKAAASASQPPREIRTHSRQTARTRRPKQPNSRNRAARTQQDRASRANAERQKSSRTEAAEPLAAGAVDPGAGRGTRRVDRRAVRALAWTPASPRGRGRSGQEARRSARHRSGGSGAAASNFEAAEPQSPARGHWRPASSPPRSGVASSQPLHAVCAARRVAFEVRRQAAESRKPPSPSAAGPPRQLHFEAFDAD